MVLHNSLSHKGSEKFGAYQGSHFLLLGLTRTNSMERSHS